MKHPFEWIPGNKHLPLFWAFLALTVAILFLFQGVNQPLMNAAAPSGIISLQLAWTPGNTHAILNSWDEDSRLFAAFGLGFDYLFMPAYAFALAFGSLLVTGRHPGWFSRLGAWMGYSAILAACLDALENLLQFQQLFHGRVELAFIVGSVATLKFTFLLLALLYCLTGWLWKKKTLKM